MAKSYKDYDDSRLRSLSDEDLNRLYYDAKTGMRKNSDSFDDEGHREGGYTQGEFYADSLEPYHGLSKKEQELAELYRQNVFGQSAENKDYLSGWEEDSRRTGFEMIFAEKDRRRDEQYIQDIPEPKAEPVEKLPEPAKRTTPTGPVQYSDSLKNAKSMVQAYQTGQKAPFEQAQTSQNQQSFGTQQQTDFTADRNPSAQEEGDEPAKDPQMFADQYKLDLIKTGATKDEDKEFKPT